MLGAGVRGVLLGSQNAGVPHYTVIALPRGQYGARLGREDRKVDINKRSSGFSLPQSSSSPSADALPRDRTGKCIFRVEREGEVEES